MRNRAELRRLLANRFSSAPSADWLAVLDAADVPSGAVNDVIAAFAQPQAQSREMSVSIDHPQLGSVRQIGLPYKLTATPATIRLAPPLLGEQGPAILGELGYSAEEVASLRESGVI